MLPDLTIPRLHAAYAQGRTATAVMTEILAALDALDDDGIFISRIAAREVLSAADKLGSFDPVSKPLWGVPFAVKDNIDVAGMPTTAACPAEAYTPQSTAECVNRLLAAGAILVGKTNLDQYATGLVGVRTPYPVPRNAIDPELVPGGSSSGSAVAVARGLVTFALGTDTAGSGRVPAGFNNIVGVKPSLGAISTRGVVPACRSLDCVSVFALTVADGWRVLTAMAGDDAADPYSRPVAFGSPGLPPALRIGIPSRASIEFFGDRIAEAAFAATRADLERLGYHCVEIDLTLFRQVAELLYAGPWVAERYHAIRDVIENRPDVLHPVTRDIIASATRYSAADAFAGFYELQRLRRATEPCWDGIDVLMVPTTPTIATCAELDADPLTPNARLGTYTNFVNLLDMAALAIPGRFREDGRPAGVTLIAPRGSDALLAALGERLHHAAGVPLGALATRVPEPSLNAPVAPQGWHELVVVGAHMSGLPLNHELTRLGATFLRSTSTEPCYRLYALAGGPPYRPGLLRANPAVGAAIDVEVWALPTDGFGRFVAAIPAPLGFGRVRLSDGSQPTGFLVEAEGVVGARDITAYGGWRAYMKDTASV